MIKAKAKPFLSVLVAMLACGCHATPVTDNTAGTGFLPPGSGASGQGVTGAAGNRPPGAGVGTAAVGGPIAGTAGVPPTGTAGSGSAPVSGTGGPVTPPGTRGSWMSFGGDLGHTRATAETTLSTANATRLGAAFDIKAPGVTSTPAVYQGVIYWGDWGGYFHATEIPTGTAAPKELWKLDRSANKGGYSGSPALTHEVVVIANRNGLLTSVDRVTGVALWEYKLDAGPHTYIWSSPVIAEADDVVVIGVGGAGTRDNGIALPQSQLDSFHGFVEGVSLASGKSLWKFAVSPTPGGSGCSVWSSGALDIKRKLVFIGTGNNYQQPTSKYEDSLLALDYTTGKLTWSVQFTANDAFTAGNILGGIDGDVGATPNLFSIGTKDVVGVGDKPAGYHVFERDTGKLVWERKALTSSVGYQGGILQPATYANGSIYVVSNNGTSSSTLFAFNAADGMDLWSAALTDPTFGGSAFGNGVLYVGDSGGNIGAVDVMGGKLLWAKKLPAGRGGGFSLVDGLLLTGYGYHFSESAMEPLMGGLIGFALDGKVSVPDAGNTSDCVPNTAVTSAATFSNVYQGVLCANGCDKVCHTSNTGAAQMGLAGKAAAYTNLVGVPAKDATGCAGKGDRVKANDATASVLYQKLANTQTCGSRMPPGSGDLPAAQLDALKAWINAGAPNN